MSLFRRLLIQWSLLRLLKDDSCCQRIMAPKNSRKTHLANSVVFDYGRFQRDEHGNVQSISAAKLPSNFTTRTVFLSISRN